MPETVHCAGGLGRGGAYIKWPIQIDTPTPPDYMLHNEVQADAWREACRWRCILMAAEGERA
jgi:hypothetical protein